MSLRSPTAVFVLKGEGGQFSIITLGRRMKISKIFLLFFLVNFVSGCALPGALLGPSLKSIRQEKVKYTKIFDKDALYCYKKTLEALKEWHADAYEKRARRYIVAMELDSIFNNCSNTTVVDIIFDESEPGKTEVIVFSLNYSLAQFVADKLFQYLENPDAPAVPVIGPKDVVKVN